MLAIVVIENGQKKYIPLTADVGGRRQNDKKWSDE